MWLKDGTVKKKSCDGPRFADPVHFAADPVPTFDVGPDPASARYGTGTYVQY